MSMPEIEAVHEIGGIEYTPFPASRKQSVGLVNEVVTDVTSIYFADKIMITISQGGRLSQWVRFLLFRGPNPPRTSIINPYLVFISRLINNHW